MDWLIEVVIKFLTCMSISKADEKYNARVGMWGVKAGLQPLCMSWFIVLPGTRQRLMSFHLIPKLSLCVHWCCKMNSWRRFGQYWKLSLPIREKNKVHKWRWFRGRLWGWGQSEYQDLRWPLCLHFLSSTPGSRKQRGLPWATYVW